MNLLMSSGVATAPVATACKEAAQTGSPLGEPGGREPRGRVHYACSYPVRACSRACLQVGGGSCADAQVSHGEIKMMGEAPMPRPGVWIAAVELHPSVVQCSAVQCRAVQCTRCAHLATPSPKHFAMQRFSLPVCNAGSHTTGNTPLVLTPLPLLRPSCQAPTSMRAWPMPYLHARPCPCPTSMPYPHALPPCAPMPMPYLHALPRCPTSMSARPMPRISPTRQVVMGAGACGGGSGRTREMHV